MKITDEQLLETLEETCGIYSLTAKRIEEKYNVKYTRQAVRSRILNNHKEYYEELIEAVLDNAEGNLLDLIDNAIDERVKLNAIKFYLTMKGAERGYSNKLDLKVDAKSKHKVELLPTPKTDEQIEFINNYLSLFNNPEEDIKLNKN